MLVIFHTCCGHIYTIAIRENYYRCSEFFMRLHPAAKFFSKTDGKGNPFPFNNDINILIRNIQKQIPHETSNRINGYATTFSNLGNTFKKPENVLIQPFLDQALQVLLSSGFSLKLHFGGCHLTVQYPEEVAPAHYTDQPVLRIDNGNEFLFFFN